MSPEKSTAMAQLAQRVAVEPVELERTLMATVFKGASPAEFTVLVALANKYDLDPFAKEIYAFPKQGGGIVPLVPIDGWLKIIHRHPDYDGMETVYADEMVQPGPRAKRCYEWVETRIYHKSTPDRPTVHREYVDEMYRDTGPWNTTTKRQLEWKSVIQTGRKAFGLGGIYDQDEAERISAGEMAEPQTADVEVDAGELIGEVEYGALLDEMHRTGLSEAAVLKNLERKSDYRGKLEDLPVRLYVVLMNGLAAMPSKNPPEPEPEDDGPGDGAPVEETPAGEDEDEREDERFLAATAPGDDPAETVAEHVSSAPHEEPWLTPVPEEQAAEQPRLSTQQLRTISTNWRKLEDAGWPEKELRQLLQEECGVTSRKQLTVAQASRFNKRLLAELGKLNGAGAAA